MTASPQETKNEPRLEVPLTDLFDPKLYINRELSWLEFNRRCLAEALNPDLQLLERVRFLAIFSNNLDEFFMVRVSGLKDQVTAGLIDTTPDGMSPYQQLVAIRERVTPMIHEQRRVFHEDIIPKLTEHGINIYPYIDLLDWQKTALRTFFELEVFPILTPLAVDPGRPFPFISNLSLNLAVIIVDENDDERFARLKVPTGAMPRLVELNSVMRKYASSKTMPLGHHFIWLEDLIIANLDMMFPGMTVKAASVFRITRNNDMEIAEEEASDLLETVEEGVRQRRFGQVVRMSVVDTMPDEIRDLLMENLEVTAEDVYTVRAPLGMNDLFALANIDAPALKAPPFVPRRSPAFLPNEDIFSSIRRQDILMHRPYDSFSPVVEFFEEAAEDPQVLAIKTTLYRVGSNSPIVKALMKAQENSKQVAVLVELKARFDEENNIGWARALENVGVHVVYGLVGLKTHSKIALVVRREPDGVRRYVHLSTGNYNASTARIYTDLCLFTAHPQFAADASELFNRLTGYATNTQYRKLLVAPEHLRNRLSELIRREIDHAQSGRDGHLILKMNSLVDSAMIRLLYQASMAGVKVDLLVRGICCLRPGIPGISENIRVTCLLGRFLEHARIYYFHNNGDAEIYSGSADLMPRNLNNRVETLWPVESPALKRQIIDDILAIEMQDNVKARVLLTDGTYEAVQATAGEKSMDSQRCFMERCFEPPPQAE